MKQSGATAREREIVAKRELAREVLRSFGTVRLQVTGHSMLPALWPGDVLRMERSAISEVSASDIVLCVSEQGDRLFAHRVLRTQTLRGEVQVITQGDALPLPDAPVSESQLLGKVTHIERRGHGAGVCSAPGFSKKLLAALVRRSELLGRILVHMHVTRASARAW